MNSNSWKDRVYTFPAVMSQVEPDVDLDGRAPLTLRLTNPTGPWNAVTWLPLSQFGTEDSVLVGRATAVDVRGDLADEPLVLTQWRNGDPLQLFDLLPDSLCTIPGTVLQFCEIVRGVHSEALRKFLASVFTMPAVFRTFWNAPASRAHHHSFDGGLAQHSLEVAVLAGAARGMEQLQHDLIVAFALLHDIGKVWAYDNRQLTADVRQHGHERLGHLKLRAKLDALCDDDPVSGRMLSDLLSCVWKHNYRNSVATLGGIVQAMDRFSAARNVGTDSADRRCKRSI